MSCLKPIHKILLYSKGGVGKSTFGAQLAADRWKTTGKKSRVITADGGGEKAFQPLIEEGIVQLWPIDSYSEASIFANLDLATKGWWPEDPLTADSPLQPPVRVWKPCNNCGQDSGATGQAQPVTCMTCKKPFGSGIRLNKVVEPINGFEDIGAYIFEGATSFGQLMLNRLRTVDSGGGRQIKDGDFTIAGLGKQHYGDAQNYAAIQVANTHTIPVPIVLWTALELRGVDDDGKPSYGPAFPGKALLERCIPWFTDVIHLDTVATGVKDKDGQEKLKRQLFFSTHYPADCKPFGFGAKNSSPLGGGFPEVMDYPPTGNTAGEMLRKMDEAKEKAKQLLLS